VFKFVSDFFGFLWVLWFPLPIKLIAMIYLKTVESGVKHHNSNPIQMRLLYSTTNTRDFYIKLMNVYFYYDFKQHCISVIQTEKLRTKRVMAELFKMIFYQKCNVK
jgi:hypothetical protein